MTGDLLGHRVPGTVVTLVGGGRQRSRECCGRWRAGAGAGERELRGCALDRGA
jgi:hypothetical protein